MTERNRSKKSLRDERIFHEQVPGHQRAVSGIHRRARTATKTRPGGSRRWKCAAGTPTIQSRLTAPRQPRPSPAHLRLLVRGGGVLPMAELQDGLDGQAADRAAVAACGAGRYHLALPLGQPLRRRRCATPKRPKPKARRWSRSTPRAPALTASWDLLGNVWEWCSNGQASGEITDVTVDILRVVRGGSFMSPRNRTSINFHYFLNPLYRYQSIGFRIVCETGAEFLGRVRLKGLQHVCAPTVPFAAVCSEISEASGVKKVRLSTSLSRMACASSCLFGRVDVEGVGGVVVLDADDDHRAAAGVPSSPCMVGEPLRERRIVAKACGRIDDLTIGQRRFPDRPYPARPCRCLSSRLAT